MSDPGMQHLQERGLLEVHKQAQQVGYHVRVAKGWTFDLEYGGRVPQYRRRGTALRTFANTEEGQAEARAFLAAVQADIDRVRELGHVQYVRATYRDGTSTEGYLVDITEGVGTLYEMGTTTAVYLPDVVLDVLDPHDIGAEQSMLVHYPFEKDDVVIFRDGHDHRQGRFVRTAERQGGIVVFVGETLIGVFYSHIVRVRNLACDFYVPPAYMAASAPAVEGGMRGPGE